MGGEGIRSCDQQICYVERSIFGRLKVNPALTLAPETLKSVLSLQEPFQAVWGLRPECPDCHYHPVAGPAPYTRLHFANFSNVMIASHIMDPPENLQM